MLEALALIAIIGCIAHLVHLDRRMKQVEAALAALGADRQEPGELAGEQRSPAESDGIDLVEAPERPEPGQMLYAGTRPGSSEQLPGDQEVQEPATDDSHHEPSANRPGRGVGFEELFGRKLPIWAGGITLAVAGMLIVKLSIEAGLLSPSVRVVLGLLFGLALIAAAELALRQEGRVQDERVRQALSGAGIASLYASVLVASNLYRLIGPLEAMLGVALVTALAMALSLRFGAPSALLGLAGGLAAPALIGSDEPNIPLLSLYLALAVGGLCTLSRGQRWAWLGLTALVGGFGWGLLLMLSGALDAPASISIALLLLLLGVGLPLIGFAGSLQPRIQLAAGVLAAAQMAALVATGGFDMLHWALFAMISVALQWLSFRRPELERLPPVGLLIALLLAGAWPEPVLHQFIIVLAGTALIYGVPATWRLWRPGGTIIEAAQLSAILVGGFFLAMFQFYVGDGSDDRSFGLLAIALALGGAGLSAAGWTKDGRREDPRFAILAVTSAVLAAAASTLLLPEWLIGAAIAATGLALLALSQAAQDHRLEPFAWILAAIGLLLGAAGKAYGDGAAWRDLLQWSILALIAAAFAWRGRVRHGREAAQFLVPILLYVALAPVVPDPFDPLVAPAMLAAMSAVPRRYPSARWATLLLIAAWAIDPLARWLGAGAGSLIGDPVMAGDVPGPAGALLRLVTPAAVLAFSWWISRDRLDRRERLAGWGLAALLGPVGLHSLYKLLFAIDSLDEFVAHGLAERTAWELLMLGAAALAWRLRLMQLASLLVAAAGLHFGLYTLFLHDPLWTPQAVGPLPFLNLLPLAYAVPALGLVAAARLPVLATWIAPRARTVSWMILVLLFSATMLRQLFHGSLLVEPGLGQLEDISRSILAILLAIGFLTWGIRRQDRDWRIASLVLMLAAVAKVFLWDTSGLEGLTRIASFVALGFSLIGIGWLYSRQLGPAKA